MLKKQLDAVNLKLDLLNAKVIMQSKNMQQELKNLNELFSSNTPVNEPVAQKQSTCTLL